MRRALQLSRRGAYWSRAVGLLAASAVSLPCAYAFREQDEASLTDLTKLHAWLGVRGVVLSGVAIAPVTATREDDSPGLGLYATRPAWSRRWIPFTRRPVLATFPLDGTLTGASAAHNAEYGECLAQALSAGTLSEREAVQLSIAVERQRGDASPLAPWLRTLSQPPTPLFWSATEMKDLAGTTLAEAVFAQKLSLSRSWVTRVANVATQCVSAAACPPVTEADMRWATSIFWSRAMTFPSPRTGEFEEGILPGLDYANHAERAAAAWVVRGLEFVLELRRGRLRAGDEVRIDYGRDRSNEELLFLYGFAVPNNSADALMVAPPLPVGDWDAVSAARVSLLQQSGVAPQTFFTLRALRRPRAARAAVEHALLVLRPFVLTPSELAARLEGREVGDEVRERKQALLLLLRLLEQRAAAMAVTGSAEEDEAKLTSSEIGPKHRAALLYRASQKRLCAAYLAIVHALATAEGLRVV